MAFARLAVERGVADERCGDRIEQVRRPGAHVASTHLRGEHHARERRKDARSQVRRRPVPVHADARQPRCLPLAPMAYIERPVAREHQEHVEPRPRAAIRITGTGTGPTMPRPRARKSGVKVPVATVPPSGSCRSPPIGHR